MDDQAAAAPSTAPAPPLRRSPLHDRHLAAGARMAAFAGWTMPIDYGSVVAEHLAVRGSAGMFDLTHLGTVTVRGAGAEDVIARSFTNDVRALPVGRSHYTLCLDEHGGIVDDLLVYRLPDAHLVVPNAANTDAVTARLLDAAIAVAPDTVVTVDPLACVAVQGPDSVPALAAAMAATGMAGDPATLDYLECTDIEDGQVLSRSGYTGEAGFEIFCHAAVAGALWDALAAGGVAPAGLGSRDTLRLEMGYPLHGNDISIDTSPVEAGLAWAVKGSGFVGQPAHEVARAAGAARRLRGIRAAGRRPPRAGDAVLVDGQIVGAMTSGSFSPVLQVGIGLAYLDADLDLGAAVEVDVRGKGVPAEVVRPPFVQARTRP